MLTFALAAAAAIGAPAVASDDVQVRTRMWTVGTQAGTRPSTEVCRWKAEVFVGGRVDTAHVVEGSKAGNCLFVKNAVEAERSKKVSSLQMRLSALASN